MGIGQPGRLTQLEDRVERHEHTVQRMKGLVGAAGGLLTVFHLAIGLFSAVDRVQMREMSMNFFEAVFADDCVGPWCSPGNRGVVWREDR